MRRRKVSSVAEVWKMKKGFTLIEILVVTAIIAVVSGIVVPVVANARSEGGKAVAISNLRQCYIGLSLYTDAYGSWKYLPHRDVALATLGTKITCDPGDTWRTSCEEPSSDRLVGSFGYLQSSQNPNRPDWLQKFIDENDPAFPLMVSIFHSHSNVSKFDGDSPKQGKGNPYQYEMPSKVYVLRSDGRIAYEPVKGRIVHQGLTWSSLFVFLWLGGE